MWPSSLNPLIASFLVRERTPFQGCWEGPEDPSGPQCCQNQGEVEGAELLVGGWVGAHLSMGTWGNCRDSQKQATL